MTDQRSLEIAQKFASYPGANEPTIRGNKDVLAFVRAILSEVEGQRIDELLAVHAALDGEVK